MKKYFYRWIGAAGAIATLAVVLPLMAAYNGKESKEVTVKFQDCPEVVQKAILDNSQGGEIIEVEKETGKDGKVVYEAEVKKADGKKFDVKVSEDGMLIGANDDGEKGEADDDGEDED